MRFLFVVLAVCNTTWAQAQFRPAIHGENGEVIFAPVQQLDWQKKAEAHLSWLKDGKPTVEHVEVLRKSLPSDTEVEKDPNYTDTDFPADGIANQYRTATDITALDSNISAPLLNEKTHWKKVTSIKVAMLIRGAANSRFESPRASLRARIGLVVRARGT